MGNNLPAKKYSAGQRTIRRLQFELDGDGTYYIDIAKALSALNRRFYRQGLYYYINKVEFHESTSSGIATATFNILPDNWVTKNAWVRGFKMYQMLNSRSNIPRNKYHDFKVRWSNGVDSYLNPVGIGSSYAGSEVGSTATSKALPLIGAEWNLSEYVVPSEDEEDPGVHGGTDTMDIHVMGGHAGAAPNFTSYGLISGYAKTRATVDGESPDLDEANAILDPLDLAFNDGHKELAEVLVDENEQPPYSTNDYPGESTVYHAQRAARLTTTSSSGVSRASGFCAPLGLLQLVTTGTAGAYAVTVELAPGPYHGVYAERVV